MQLLYVILTSVLLSVSSGIPYATIEKAFEKNNSSELIKMGGDKILIDILGKEGVYSHSQGNLVLKDFFTKHPGNQFDFVFKGKESLQGSFAIGNYISKKDKFRVTIHFKKVKENYQIESLTIENS